MSKNRKDIRYYKPSSELSLLRVRDRTILFDIIRKFHPEVIEDLNKTLGPLIDQVIYKPQLRLQVLEEVKQLSIEKPKAFEEYKLEPFQYDLLLAIYEGLHVWAEKFTEYNFQLEKWSLALALETCASDYRDEFAQLSVSMASPEWYEDFANYDSFENWNSDSAPTFNFELVSLTKQSNEIDTLEVRQKVIQAVKDKTLDYNPSLETRAEAESRIPHLVDLFEQKLKQHFDDIETAIQSEGWKPIPKKRARTLSNLDHYFWLYFRLRGVRNRDIAETWTNPDDKDILLKMMNSVPQKPLLKKTDIQKMALESLSKAIAGFKPEEVDIKSENDSTKFFEVEKAVSKAVSNMAKSIGINL